MALQGTLPNDVVYRLMWATKSILLVADNVHFFLPPFTTTFFYIYARSISLSSFFQIYDFISGDHPGFLSDCRL